MKKSLLTYSLLVGPLLLADLAIPAEATPSIVGHYHARTDNDVGVELAILKEGTATLTLTIWDGGAVGVFENRDRVAGRWERKGESLVLTFPRYGKTRTVEYAIHACLRYDPHYGDACSFGLQRVASNMPGIYTWNLWKYEPTKR